MSGVSDPPAGYLSSIRSTLGKQTAAYFSAQGASALLGFVIAWMLTWALSTGEYGRYQFLVSVFSISVVFFDFGLNPAVKRLAAISTGEDNAEVLGAAVLSALGLGILLAIVLAVLSIFVETWSEKSAGSGAILLFMAPFAILYPLYELVLSVTQGTNNIRDLSIATVLPKVLFIVAIVAVGFWTDFSSKVALLLFLATFGLTAVAIALKLRPRFGRTKDSFRVISREIREFGFNLYYGRVIDGVMNGFDKILITRFHGLSPTGYYALAMTLVLPVSMFSRAVAASAYKRFTIEESISRKTLLFNASGCILSGVGLTIACLYGVPVVFPEKYAASLSVLPYLAAGSALAGMNAPYHAFLAAKRQGAVLRTMSLITSGLNIVLNLALIPFMALIGATIAYISTFAVNLGLNLYYYRRYLVSVTADKPDFKV